jgi:hypothetical protein
MSPTNRYRVDWHPQGRGGMLAVYDGTTGLVIAEGQGYQRPPLEELVRLANKGHELEQADAGES